jgi:hypothetical protein
VTRSSHPSGGLVFGVDPGASATILAAFETSGHDAVLIGSASVGNGELELR